ncbi:MAG: DNA-deoxyinosine glycosylase [Velocimicrobium sp.]
MQSYEMIQHTFEPIFDQQSKILILGSFPSVKSRENGFYYGHPQNRFWKVIAKVYDRDVPKTVDEKIDLLLSCQIAIWDVIKSCNISGSSDSSIKNVIPMDLKQILTKCEIKQIYANGKTAAKLYRTFAQEITKMDIVELPSTSPANAIYSVERLTEEWGKIKNIQ